MPEMRVCGSCGDLHSGNGPRCQSCARHHRPPKQQATHAHVYDTATWKRARKYALARDDHRCIRCGASSNLIVHHRIEISPGIDPFNTDNLDTLCRACHRAEHNRRRAHERKLQ